MAMDSSRNVALFNVALFIDGRNWERVYRKTSTPGFFSVGPIGGIGIKRGHRCCSESVKSGTLNINFV
jgi:hypothetical protein